MMRNLLRNFSLKSQSVNKSKKIQLRNLPAKKEKEHCGRQIHTDKYNKNTTLMFFFLQSKTSYGNHAFFFICSSFF